MTEAIESFRGQYRFLSNFFPIAVPLEGDWYPTVEHAYQAAKTASPEERANIRQAATPGEAKKRGRQVICREDWESVKVEYMRYLLWYKFSMYPELGKALVDTGNAPLIEGNTWGDTFWGICKGQGTNMLGRLLMEVRESCKDLPDVQKAGKPVDKVFYPGPNRIFVFGSNRAGVHGAGAAREAYERFGAIPGIGEGLQGKSYALPTKDEDIRTLPLEEVQKHVDNFIQIAWERRDLNFFVTRVGCGLAGYNDKQIAPLFKLAPPNCELPYGWEVEENYAQTEESENGSTQ